MSIKLNAFTCYDGTSSSSVKANAPAPENKEPKETKITQPKSYEIQKGDCLWNIVKNEYGYTSNSEIIAMVNRVAEENGIENPSLIKIGNQIKLPDLFEDVFNNSESEKAELSKADELALWNSSENAIKSFAGEDIEDFKMFDYESGNSEDYFNKLLEFSQSYIDKYDQDGDGSLNSKEFVDMGLDGVEFNKDFVEALGYEYSDEIAEILDFNQRVALGVMFDNFLMNGNDTLDADELAIQFLYADFADDPNGLADGKINFETYNTFAGEPIEYNENGELTINEQYVKDIMERKSLYGSIFGG